MKFVKPLTASKALEVFTAITGKRDENIPEQYHHGLRLPEQSMSLDTTIKYITRLEDKKLVETHIYLFLDHQGVMYTKKHPNNRYLDDFDKDNVAVAT